ncbi:OpgC domain-containing protein [Dyadobacter sp. LHD-138]|uniref:OpgC domain-containing protein n=1 Tax=Dyadobacter sp. LHD-138 TaxID=3071413 RepID=UPI0027DEF7D4|nr:OpgC domain-containing protein [Dyadobacter sp. LHD-138]MDQ6481065.1 OpgC domain-containing protein [Dyadobacter sp. LHD-138]
MIKRNNSLDVLRGILLIIITVNHIGGPLSRFTFQPMGFVSAAEGFIFLSRYVLGLVFGKRLLEGREMELATILKRSLKIYGYHVITLLILLIPFCFDHLFLGKWQSPELIPLIENPRIASTAYFLLLFQPEHLDILPMYILFIPIGIIALKAFSRGKKILVLGLSLLLWIFGQFELSSITGLGQIRLGFFNLFGWQILFITGCFLGYSRTLGIKIIPKTKVILACTLILLFCFAIVRYGTGLEGWLINSVRSFSEKSNLQIFRLINFFVLAYIIGFIIDSGHFPKSKPLAFIGRHSLQVFAFQIVLVYCYTPVREEIHSMGFYPKLAGQLLCALLLFVPALMHKYYINTFRPVKSYSSTKNITLAEQEILK